LNVIRREGTIFGKKANNKSAANVPDLLESVTFEPNWIVNFFTDPAYSSEYHVNKLKNMFYTPGTYIYSLWSSVAFICLYENFLSVMWCFKQFVLLTIARRWVGSGSVKSGYGYEGSGFIKKSYRSRTLFCVENTGVSQNQEKIQEKKPMC
jgi:hypothetical protein